MQQLIPELLPPIADIRQDKTLLGDINTVAVVVIHGVHPLLRNAPTPETLQIFLSPANITPL